MLHLEFLINQSGNCINQYTGYQSNKLETATKMGGAITTVAIIGVDGRGIAPVSAIFQAPCQVPVTIFPHGYVQKHGNNYTTPRTAMGYTHLLTDGTANGSNSVLGSQAWTMGRSGNREFLCFCLESSNIGTLDTLLAGCSSVQPFWRATCWHFSKTAKHTFILLQQFLRGRCKVGKIRDMCKDFTRRVFIIELLSQ